MLARTHSAGLLGIDGYVVSVESDIGPGLSGVSIIGQVDGPLHGAGLRAHAALRCCGFELPRCKQIVNLAPAEQRKDSTGMDLAIACALLVSHGVIPAASLAGMMLWGELAPDGSLRSPVGTLIAAETARRDGFRVLALPLASAHEAALIAGLDLLLVPDLPRLIAHLRGETSLVRAPTRALDHDAPSFERRDDLVEVSDPLALLALEVMIAGGHHLLIHGAHGSGKTTIGRHVAGLLDEVGYDEALELTKLQGTRSPTGLVRIPQVRTPDPTVSAIELLGGGKPARPGEVSLAHLGVLVLDELPQFSQDCLRGLLHAMDGAMAVAGLRFPAWFRLLATTTRCPCGWLGHPERTCVDQPSAIRRFLARIPTPLLDRLDLVVPLGSAPHATSELQPGEVRRRIAAARLRQRERLAGTPWRTNAEIPTSGTALEQLLSLTPAAQHLLTATEEDRRDRQRLCRIARTVADLDTERDPAAPIDVDAVELAHRLRELPLVSLGERT